MADNRPDTLFGKPIIWSDAKPTQPIQVGTQLCPSVACWIIPGNRPGKFRMVFDDPEKRGDHDG